MSASQRSTTDVRSILSARLAAEHADAHGRHPLAPGGPYLSATTAAELRRWVAAARRLDDAGRRGGLLGRWLGRERPTSSASTALVGAVCEVLWRVAGVDPRGPAGPAHEPGDASPEAARESFRGVREILAGVGLSGGGLLTLAQGLWRTRAGGRDTLDLWLRSEDLRAVVAASFVGHTGASELAREDAIEVYLPGLDDAVPRVQLDVVGAEEGVSVLFHDERSLEALRRGEPLDAMGRATFAGSTLSPGEAAYRMAFHRGHNIEQPLGPHLVRVHYQTPTGDWSY